MQIKDARSGQLAAVNRDGQVSTDGDGLLRDSYEIGKNYCWRVTDADIDATDTMLLVRNESDVPLAIDRIFITGGNAASNYQIHVVTLPFVLTGTNVVAFNMNYANGNPKIPPATAASDETLNIQGDIIYEPRIGINVNYDQKTPGLILGNGVAVAIDQVTESTSGRAAIYGHYVY
jgi:hypothetical protein